ncbi:hypothetical protein EGW08_017468, partial [Elysia chlorotica]
MTTVESNVAELLKVGEEEFDTAIKAMTVKSLMGVISGLQREMSREQDAFNSLSGELHKNKGRNSHQAKQISRDMVASQQRLTLLMNRSMKCFAQGSHDNNNSSTNSDCSSNSNSGKTNGTMDGEVVVQPQQISPVNHVNGAANGVQQQQPQQQQQQPQQRLRQVSTGRAPGSSSSFSLPASSSAGGTASDGENQL